MERILLLMLLATGGGAIVNFHAKADQDGPKSACMVDNPPANCSDYQAITVTSLVSGNSVPLGGPDPICGQEASSDVVKTVINVAANALGGNLAGAAGDVMNYIQKSGLTQTLINSTGGTVHDILVRNGPRTAYANCATIVALIPSNAIWDGGYRISNVDIDASPADPAARFGGCAPGNDCSNGWSRFMVIPNIEQSGGGKAVWTQFANWSDRRRVGFLTVFFKMPVGAPIPHPM